LGAKLGFYDSNTGKQLGSVAIGFKPHEIEISADGKTAYVANFGIEDYDHHDGTPGTTISVIDIPKMREKYKLSTENVKTPDGAQVSGRGPHGIKLRPSKESELFVNTEFGGDLMLVYDTKKRNLKRSFAIPAGAHNFIFSPDGKVLYLFAGASGVFKINPDTGETLAQMKLSTSARGLHYTTDKRFIIAAVIVDLPGLNRVESSLKVLNRWKVAEIPSSYILQTMTVNSAELLGLEKSKGVLEKSFDADIIALKNDPLENIENVKTVRFVMKDGKVVRQD